MLYEVITDRKTAAKGLVYLPDSEGPVHDAHGSVRGVEQKIGEVGRLERIKSHNFV